MAFNKLECPNCKAPLKLSENEESAYCKYCKTEVSLVDRVHHNVEIEGIATTKQILERAHQLLRDDNYEGAAKLFSEAINVSPNNYEAWWGKFCCERAFAAYYGFNDKYGNSSPYTKAKMLLDLLEKYAYRAIEYAPEEQKGIYIQAISGDEKFVKDVANGVYDVQIDNSKGQGGCYIATAVYGSYQATEVITLRKFRDEILGRSFIGRLSISFYYKVSPFFVKHVMKYEKVNAVVRKILNFIVNLMEY